MNLMCRGAVLEQPETSRNSSESPDDSLDRFEEPKTRKTHSGLSTSLGATPAYVSPLNEGLEVVPLPATELDSSFSPVSLYLVNHLNLSVNMEFVPLRHSNVMGHPLIEVYIVKNSYNKEFTEGKPRTRTRSDL